MNETHAQSVSGCYFSASLLILSFPKNIKKEIRKKIGRIFRLKKSNKAIQSGNIKKKSAFSKKVTILFKKGIQKTRRATELCSGPQGMKLSTCRILDTAVKMKESPLSAGWQMCKWLDQLCMINKKMKAKHLK